MLLGPRHLHLSGWYILRMFIPHPMTLIRHPSYSQKEGRADLFRQAG